MPSVLAGLALIAGGVIALGASGGGPDSPSDGPGIHRARSADALKIGPGRGGKPIPAGFLGLSIEFQAIRAYTGHDPRHVNPVLVQLVANLSPGQAPVLRIGGDSTDVSWVPMAGVATPRLVSYDLTPSWLATTGALTKLLRARLILGVNLAANLPSLAAAEAQAYVRSFGADSIEALEIGNEPNVYGKIALFPTPSGNIMARPRDYGYASFVHEFRSEAATLGPAGALAAPALAAGPKPDKGSWVQSLPSFLGQDRRISMLTVHRYPLRNCFVGPRDSQYPTVAHLMARYATVGLANSLKRYVAIAHARHRALRVDELNSVACRGKAGVSDTFASSLWMLDALFGLVRLGVDGVNVHTLPRSAYELFQFSRSSGRWQAFVRPVYYGMQMFAQATPPGSRLLKVGGRRAGPGLSVWATRSPGGVVHVVVINKSPSRSRRVVLQAPRGSAAGVTVERLRAPSLSSRRGVTLGGQTYGAETSTGDLAPARVTTAHGGADGVLAIAMPRASAAMVTFKR